MGPIKVMLHVCFNETNQNQIWDRCQTIESVVTFRPDMKQHYPARVIYNKQPLWNNQSILLSYMIDEIAVSNIPHIRLIAAKIKYIF